MEKPSYTNDMFTFSCRLNYFKQAVSKKGIATLYLYVYLGSDIDKDFDNFPVKLRWPVEYIDADGVKVLPRFPKDPDVQDYNLIISGQANKYNEIAKKYRLADRVLTLKQFKRELKIGDSKKSLVSYMDLRRNELLRTKEISLRTWKNVGSTIREIKIYQEDVLFEQINLKWMKQFKRYLKDKVIHKDPAKQKKLEPGTIWTRIRDLKAYLGYANDEVDIWVDQEAIDFPNPEPEVETVYLNRDELRRFMLLQDPLLLTENQYRVLKAFLFQCFTSLRISDLYLSNAKWVLSDNLLVFTQRKNNERKPKTIKIPLIPMAKSFIIDTLKTFFDLPTEQEFNRTLKELASMADIRKNLHSHVGRHTFGYLFMTTVGNLYALKEILGHSKITTTERYAHLDEDYYYEQAVKIQRGFEDVANRGIFRSRATIN